MAHKKNVDHEIYKDPIEDFELSYDDGAKKYDATAPISKTTNNKATNSLSCLFKGVFDGFEGKEMRHVVKYMKHRARKEGQGLTNLLCSGKLDKLVDQRVCDSIHHFANVHPDTGRILGAVRGNDFFNFGGLHNNLTNTGKVYLDNMIRGKCCKRKVHRFKPVVKPAENEGAMPPRTTPTAPRGQVRPPVQPGKPVPVTPMKPADVSDYGLDFKHERDRCLKNRQLFEDPEFPASDRSLYYRTPPRDRVVWKRPGEIVANPQLLVAGESRFDVKQGALGDCWFLAALANITLHDTLFYRCVPPDQSFTENYAGIFHFQFWHFGKWVDVVVDDRLPTVNGQLYYMHSQANNEFWSALVEKAYAKLNGGYENLDGGTTAEALEDFTGGLTEFFDLRRADKTVVMAALVKGMEMGSMFGCSIDANVNIREAQLRNGLVCGHAYSVTALHNVTYMGQNQTLLRLRNPWGNDKEWNGRWSDGSSEWNQLDSTTKREMGVEFAKDGEFWMAFEDFFNNFTQLECCNLSAAIFDEISEMTGVNVKAHQVEEEYQWHENSEDGAWDSRLGTAGGCNNNPNSYPNNPQYASRFTAPKASVENDGNVTVILAVLQKNRRALRTKGQDLLPIGLSVYKAEDARRALTADFFRRNAPIARTTVFVDTREVTVRFRVPPGEYVCVPCTFDAYDDADFLMRVYANADLQTDLLQH